MEKLIVILKKMITMTFMMCENEFLAFDLNVANIRGWLNDKLITEAQYYELRQYNRETYSNLPM